MRFERAIQQAEVHNPRRAREFQAVGFHKTVEAVRAFHKFVSESRAPCGRVFRSLRNRANAIFARVCSANHDRETVIESQWRLHDKMEPLHIFSAHRFEDSARIFLRFLLQHSSQRCAGVFHVHVYALRQQCLVADVRSGKIKSPLDAHFCVRLDLLRQQFPKNGLFREIFRADDDRVLPAAAAADKNCRHNASECAGAHHCLAWRSCRSSSPSPMSATSAKSAAGIAPARITRLSTMASPRKMNSPSPPAPTAAAIVAMPMVHTAAMRIPASSTGKDSGSSTRKRICRPVMPMATAASRTLASTP